MGDTVKICYGITFDYTDNAWKSLNCLTLNWVWDSIVHTSEGITWFSTTNITKTKIFTGVLLRKCPTNEVQKSILSSVVENRLKEFDIPFELLRKNLTLTGKPKVTVISSRD